VLRNRDPDGVLLSRSGRDPSAFEPLVERYSAALHGYLARRAPNDADDLLAEVWLQAYTGREGFDAKRGTARAWLFGVARNVLAAHWRRELRQPPGAGLPAQGADSDPWLAVDQRLDAAAAAGLLRRALADLPDTERELLLLVAWEELTPAEAAAVVGVPAGTARSRLHRARGRLRESLAPLSSRAPASLTGART
jgi:RNA polymerase sigma factor (sigma-70 family)